MAEFTQRTFADDASKVRLFFLRRLASKLVAELLLPTRNCAWPLTSPSSQESRMVFEAPERTAVVAGAVTDSAVRRFRGRRKHSAQSAVMSFVAGAVLGRTSHRSADLGDTRSALESHEQVLWRQTRRFV